MTIKVTTKGTELGLWTCQLTDRSVIRLSGEDRVAFLQGLVSNDVARATPDRVVFACLLSPQGKYLHDMALVSHGDSLLLETEARRADDLVARLKRYRLRSKVELAAATDWTVHAVWGEDAAKALGLEAVEGTASAIAGGMAWVDPRLAALGARLLLPMGTAVPVAAALVEPSQFLALRLGLAVPEASAELEVDRMTLLEANMDHLNGVDFQKGCYMGQEVTARSHYRGLVKRRLQPLAADGPAPSPGADVLAGDRVVGSIRRAHGSVALAHLRLDALDADLSAGGTRLWLLPTGWTGQPKEDCATSEA